MSSTSSRLFFSPAALILFSTLIFVHALTAAPQRQASPCGDWQEERHNWVQCGDLGAGGFGSVDLYKRAQTEQGLRRRHVCSKLKLYDEIAAKNMLMEDAVTEATVMEGCPRGVEHLTKLLGFFRDSSCPRRAWLVLPVALGDMAECCRKEGRKNVITSPLSAQVAMRGMVAGMYYLHLKKIAHRDLKPANLLVKKNPRELLIRGPAGEKPATWRARLPIVQIADFGLGKLPESRRQAPEQQSWVNKGTPEYWPPETSESVRCGLKGDCFIMGIIIYEVCMGGKRMLFDRRYDCPRTGVRADARKFSETLPFFERALADLMKNKVGGVRDLAFNKEAVEVVKSLVLKNPDARWTCAELWNYPEFLLNTRLGEGCAPAGGDDWRCIARLLSKQQFTRLYLKKSLVPPEGASHCPEDVSPDAELSFKPYKCDEIGQAMGGRGAAHDSSEPEPEVRTRADEPKHRPKRVPRTPERVSEPSNGEHKSMCCRRRKGQKVRASQPSKSAVVGGTLKTVREGEEVEEEGEGEGCAIL